MVKVTETKLNINHLTLRVVNFVRQNKKEAFLLGIILLIGGFLRLYKIDQYMTFLGDEGRDVIVVRRLLVDFDPILIGPRTSIGDMYLGPLYYYIMAPALLLANFSPVGPAVQIALLGIVTIVFVWWIGREWFPSPRQARGSGRVSIAGLVAAGLYAVSPTVIIYSRSSWNPNTMPFFALLSIYSIWRVFVQRTTGLWPGRRRFRWLIVAGISFAFVLQSHYLGLLLAPVMGFFWLLTLIRINKLQITNLLRYTLISSAIFALLMSPLFIFDARHGWRNFAAVYKFFTQRQTTVSARPWTALPKLWPITEKISTRLIAGTDKKIGEWVTVGFMAGITLLIVFYWKRLKGNQRKAYFLIAVWLFFALIGLGVYKQEIYDHYYGFFFAAPFLLIGGLVQSFKEHSRVAYLLSLIAILILVFNNLQNNPLKYPPNKQLQRTRDVAQKIVDEAAGGKFNIAVIAERNYEGAYQYFLEKWNAPFVIIDPQRADETITEQLFVVCELLDTEKCDPTHNPKAEVANFGWSKVDKQWGVAGVALFKLVHTQ